MTLEIFDPCPTAAIYTPLPNSADLSVGFPYTQTYEINLGGTSAQFIFKDPTSSLVIADPTTECIILTREIQNMDNTTSTDLTINPTV